MERVRDKKDEFKLSKLVTWKSVFLYEYDLEPVI